MATPTAQQFLANLRTYLGVTEFPYGSNRTRIGVEFGWNGVPWCAETMSVVAENVGFGRKFWSASTDVWEAMARRGTNGARWISKLSTPRPGDIAVWDWRGDGTANHVSAVETARADGKLVTIGGNESNSCKRAVRSKSGLRGYVRLPFLIPVHQIVHPVLHEGSTGPAVAELQRKLNVATGAGLRITNPAGFGPKTKAAVINFQKYFRLNPDGIVGPKTWGVLDYAYAMNR